MESTHSVPAIILCKTKIRGSPARLAHIDSGSVESILEMSGVVFFDHFHACPTILRNLINISAFQESKTNVGMSQTVKGALDALALAQALADLAERRTQMISAGRHVVIELGRLRAHIA